MSKLNVEITDMTASTIWWYDSAVLDWLLGGFFYWNGCSSPKTSVSTTTAELVAYCPGQQSFQNSSRSPVFSRR
ncbi:hypothetical protein T265_08595 [Opisthorchis viverrini]|uniref:Uncharacterized protein n=1 Tax=Opisthorchis viverrini TaxID=6198 RepID=A0A074Z8U5_OPIVI|nr:hypothetical protein T265_08595 [Opisthorchis viverrini]KER23553.1 hypothetical protein T265_08595 [Opisthorchis viverrini]